MCVQVEVATIHACVQVKVASIHMCVQVKVATIHACVQVKVASIHMCVQVKVAPIHMCVQVKVASIHVCVQVKVADAELLTDWQRKNKEYKQRHALTAHRETDTLARLQKFKKALEQKQAASTTAAAPVVAVRADAPEVAQPSGANEVWVPRPRMIILSPVRCCESAATMRIHSAPVVLPLT